ncbi:ShlB/FhaC/HecB family hemolysin secretion/activation protein [Pelagibacterium montanilacus]|uniref:ShlB/FhaC/HecB family hemolysin secretion/activation protein n=1 Tax=Pelagibacterium montanilacus TaxID=2185280 RepID=UPI000F8F6F2A|nr:POTRA domain-containing protein [Pelagibacterium montanilacus]
MQDAYKGDAVTLNGAWETRKVKSGLRGMGARLWHLAVAGLFVMLFGFAASGPAQAQPQQPDAATRAAQQAQERAQELGQQGNVEQQGEAVITDPVPRADLPPPGGATVTLVGVRFEPDSAFLSEAELAALAQPYVGRPIDFSGIANLVRDVNDIYAERGIVTASAILPPQNLDSGILRVQLVEGRLGSLAVVGERRTSNDYILQRIRVANEDGVVDIPTASEDINYFNRTSIAQLRMLLQPGATFGLTDLAIGVSEPPRNQLVAFLDNQGVESTGHVVGGISWRHYGMFGIDDNLLVFASASQGSIAGTVNYDLPVSTFGTRLALGTTLSGTRVIDGPTEELDVTGASSAFTGTLSQTLIADTHWSLSATASVSRGYSESALGLVGIVDTRTDRIALGFPITYSDESKAFTVQPQIVFADIEDRIAESSRQATLFAGSLSGYVDLTDEISVQARGSWQYTEEQLLPGNLLFQVGGPTTVRGYPAEGVGGDSGYLVQAELHWDMNEHVRGLGTFVFADLGEVFSTFPERTTLFSTGLGFTYAFEDRASLEVAAGIPLIDAIADQSDFAVMARLTARIY